MRIGFAFPSGATLRAILGSMNGKSNSKVTRSESLSVHYASSATVVLPFSDYERVARAACVA